MKIKRTVQKNCMCGRPIKWYKDGRGECTDMNCGSAFDSRFAIPIKERKRLEQIGGVLEMYFEISENEISHFEDEE